MKKTPKTLISIRVAEPTLEQIRRLVEITGENQTEVVSKAIDDLYEKETSRIERQITAMIFDYAATIPGGKLDSLILTISSNHQGERIFTLEKDDVVPGRVYLRKAPGGDQ
jgi:hypothetical protein